MKEILIEIDRLAEEELKRANKIHPMFHSDFEGYAEIAAVIDEATEFIEAAMEFKCDAWEAIKAGYVSGATESIEATRTHLSYAVAEMTLAIAACDKFIKSQKGRENEHRD